MTDVLTAYEGRVEMLKAIFGSGNDEAKAKPSPQLHRARMDAIAAKANAIFKPAKTSE